MGLIGNDGKDEISRFIRQRRSLILISLFIIFYKIGSLELTTVNFLGNETKIGNPEVITFSLGVFFLYFLWRYYTACREIGGVSRFWMSCTSWAEDKARNYVQKKEFGRKKVYSNQIELIGRETGARIYRVFDDRNDPASQGKEIKTRYYYSLMKVLSVIPTIFRTSIFSEYLLPYVIAAIAIAEFFGVGVVGWSMALASEAIGQDATIKVNDALAIKPDAIQETADASVSFSVPSIQQVLDAIESIAIIVGAYAAVKGLDTWKRQRKANLAEEVLAGFYEAKDIFGWVRFPGSYSNEGQTRQAQTTETENETSYKDSMFVPIERLHKHSEFFSKLQSLRYRFIAYFGKEASEPFDKLRQAHSRVTVSSQMLVTTYNRRANEEREDLKNQRKRWESDIGWWTDEAEDEIAPMIAGAIEEIERVCRPYLTEGKVKDAKS